MQPIRQLADTLGDLGTDGVRLFTGADLRAALPGLSPIAFRSVISRAEKRGLLKRICRGLYLYPPKDPGGGLILFYAAARLRADMFNYISLETALSDAGLISQIPINHITLMSSGRSAVHSCGAFGVIEFVHTRKRPTDVADQLAYDARCRLWRASVALALKDMRAARRSLDLVDWEVVDESV